MKVIGLTGNFGSGKSTIANMFEDLGAKVIDADTVAREIVEPEKDAWKEIVENFGEDIINEDKTLNRKLLANIVFSNEEKRQLLNSITHPKIVKAIREFINDCNSKNTEVVIVEASLIVEKGGMKDLIDKLIVVSTNEDIQLKRVIKRDEISENDAIRRINSQMPISEKIKHADFIIDNSNGFYNTKKQVIQIWEKLAKSNKNQ